MLTVCIAFTADAQRKKKKKGKEAAIVAVDDSANNTVKLKVKKEEKGPKAYAKFIDSTFTTKRGLITVHEKDEKFYFTFS